MSAAPPIVERAHAIGAWTLVTLGACHGSGMLVDTLSPTFFIPTEPAVLAATRVTPVERGALVGGDRMTALAHTAALRADRGRATPAPLRHPE